MSNHQSNDTGPFFKFWYTVTGGPVLEEMTVLGDLDFTCRAHVRRAAEIAAADFHYNHHHDNIGWPVVFYLHSKRGEDFVAMVEVDKDVEVSFVPTVIVSDGKQS